MREIKFRAWHKKRKKIYRVVGIHFEPYKEIELWENNHAIGCMSDDVELMQYTGLKDKNDKEIYEGDIVKQKFYNSMNLEVVDKVEIDPLYGANLRTGMAGYDYEWEIIGNIYENPELLK